jgi:hypothetical protein
MQGDFFEKPSPLTVKRPEKLLIKDFSPDTSFYQLQ